MKDGAGAVDGRVDASQYLVRVSQQSTSSAWRRFTDPLISRHICRNHLLFEGIDA